MGEVPPARLDSVMPTVLVAIMGPYPQSYGDNGHTTLDDTLVTCAPVGATPVFIPDLITDAEKASTKPGARLRGHTAMRNMAARLAREGGYDYLFLLDNDARCAEGTLTALLQHGVPVVVPKPTYPEWPAVAMICFGPQPHPDHVGLLKLNWAAHSAVLFNREMLHAFDNRSRLFSGVRAEGKDHLRWQKMGLPSYMDLDVPIQVLDLALGHKGFMRVAPMSGHRNVKREVCEGPVYEYRKSRHVAIYRCEREDCEFEMIFKVPTTEKISFEEWVAPEVHAHLAIDREHWAERAPGYRNLDWANRQAYVDAVIDAGNLEEYDVVLDVGTGPGTIAKAAAKKVERVIGLDICPEMMAGVEDGARGNEQWERGDVRAIPFPKGYFSKVFARMVFHGLTDPDDLAKAARECYRVLCPEGRFVLSEGVPPRRETEPWYTEMFKLKEERITFSAAIMCDMMWAAGFREYYTFMHVSPQVSIRNWLENSGLSEYKQGMIMDMHWKMPEDVKWAYNATFIEDDVLVDMVFAIVTGTKP